MTLTPLIKNVGLAFLAGFSTSLFTAMSAYDAPPGKAVIISILGAAVWAGGRLAVGELGSFKVDTEA